MKKNTKNKLKALKKVLLAEDFDNVHINIKRKKNNKSPILPIYSKSELIFLIENQIKSNKFTKDDVLFFNRVIELIKNKKTDK